MLQKAFANMLPEGGRILDLGCGRGRDSLAFLKAGSAVDAVDGSAEMIKATSELTGLRVEHGHSPISSPRADTTESGPAAVCFTCLLQNCPPSSPNTPPRSSRLNAWCTRS